MNESRENILRSFLARYQAQNLLILSKLKMNFKLSYRRITLKRFEENFFEKLVESLSSFHFRIKLLLKWALEWEL